MGLETLIANITDPYQRKARMYPALLALFPAIATVILFFSPSASSLANVISVAASCGGLYLVSNLSRTLGKRLEPRLYASWGGTPTTQLLRHADATIEAPTKLRYHSFLSKKIGAPLPARDQEKENPVAADEIYRSAVRWLLNHTRDEKFALLLKENIAYGFFRNAFGLKPVGIVVSVGCILWVLAMQGCDPSAYRSFF
jgi:hypothetical protein